MQVRLGRLDPELNAWVDAEQVRAPGSLQIALRGPGWERVWVVQTPAVDQITLAGRSRLATFEERGLPAFDDELVTEPARVSPASDDSKRGLFGSAVSAMAWIIATIATVAVIALATGLLDAQVIQSPSMQPTLAPGDLYVGVSTKLKAPQVGDVAAFTTRQLNGTEVAVFVHRIIGTDPAGYLTKGDANPEPEALPTKPEDVRSVQWFAMPFGGIFISLRPVMIALLGALVMLLVIRLRDDWKRP